MAMDSMSGAFRPWLSPGERVVWTGQPKQGLVLSSRDVLLIPFSLLWGGFALFWNGAVWMVPSTGQHVEWFMRLWGLPFLAAGLYITVGRFVHDAIIRKSLIYAVTDQRILVLRGTRLTSLDIDRLPRLELSERRDGSGTIAFDGETSLFGAGRSGMGMWVPALNSTPRFFCIEDARNVYTLIRDHSRR